MSARNGTQRPTAPVKVAEALTGDDLEAPPFDDAPHTADTPEAGPRGDSHEGIPATLANGKPIARQWKTKTAREILETEYPSKFLVRGLIYEDSYGMLSAQPKAQKSWDALDLAIGVADGGKWLGRFPIDRQGPAIYYSGEGSERVLKRRMGAVMRFYGIDLDGPVADLVHFHPKAPRLTDQQHLDTMRYDAETIRPAVIILDPLYLSVDDEMKSLGKVGRLLADLQDVAESVGSALIVPHHWNKTGSGTGHDRASGAGTAEWGRFLLSVSVKSKGADSKLPKSSVVTRHFEMAGQDVADLEFSCTRKIWTEDPEDPESEMHYEVVAGEAHGQHSDRGSGERDRAGNSPNTTAGRALAMLDLEPARWFTARDVQAPVGDAMKGEGLKPCATETVLTALKELAAGGHLEQRGGKGGTGDRNGYSFRVGSNAE